MCDKNNAKGIVSELLGYLATADYAIREELVLKIAILAEKFAPHYSWYVDVVLQLITLAGDFVSDDIWYRVVQIVTNHDDIQEYAAKTVYQAVKSPTIHETGVKVASYILGEFGHLIADHNGSSPRDQFEALHTNFISVSLTTRALMLSTYAKFINLYPELSEAIKPIFKNQQTSIDAEIQQRSCEYFKLAIGNEELLQTVWDVMPAFPERDSNKIGQNQSGTDSESDDLVRRRSLQNTPSSSRSSTERSVSTPQPTSQPTTPQPKTLDLLEEIFSSGNTAPVTPNLSSSSSSSNGFGSPNTPAFSSSASTANLTSSNFLDSLLSDTSSTSSSSPRGNTGGASIVASPEELNDTFKKLMLATEGVLYQDDKVQIGFKSEYSKGMGRMMLYYGNGTPEPLTSFNAVLVAPSYLDTNLQPTGSVINSRTQAQQLLTMTSTSSNFKSNEFPVLQLSFVSQGKPVNVSVKMPISMLRFNEPTSMQAPIFFQQWKLIEGSPLAEQAIIKSSRPVDLPWVTKVLSTGFRLGVLQGVDPNVNNLVATGNFVTPNNTVPVLLRIESNAAAQMYRATVKSSDGNVTTTVRDLLNMQLS